ncbi:Ig-like domain-containing protein [Desertivirga xinjiangensis]|uniref:Ig-like domain-containing protein n=1 Tax=Desertivirga xinjiangensis TaxID=539206 RepID=UPI00210B535F|nr:Ig-like domain-containing protein [Pedobacter xinjiangensis]
MRSTAPDMILDGLPKAYLTAGAPLNDGEGKGYLRLTENTENQKGHIFSQTKFPFDKGLSIEFEYFTYGGGGEGADGICFFLFDASVQPTIGGFGGSLGYAAYSGQGETSPGLKGAYLGVGFDEFGNFATNIESRNGGVPEADRKRETVTLRGSEASSYNFLTSVETNELTPSFTIGAGPRVTNTEDQGYRKAYIDIAPRIGDVGYNITVRIEVGGMPSKMVTVIDKYPYLEQAPPQLSYGFAASTGTYRNIHEIRNLRIDIYRENAVIPPTAVNDISESNPLSVYQGKPNTVNVLNNDIKGDEDIDPTSVTIVTGPQHASEPPTVDANGNIIYKPDPNYTGPDFLIYYVKDKNGLQSNPAFVYFDVKPLPKGVDDEVPFINKNTSLTVPFNVKTNDGPDGTDSEAIQITQPAHGTAVIATDGSLTYSPTLDYWGPDELTYKLRKPDGTESLPITVKLIINNPPAGRDSTIRLRYNAPDPIIDLPTLTSDTDGTVNNQTVQVQQPANGTLSPLGNGQYRYTPNAGFTGIDVFTYTIKDNLGAISAPATVTINVDDVPSPVIGLAKAVSTITRSLNGSYDIKYLFSLKNIGTKSLLNVSLKDDLGLTFTGAEFIIKSLTASGTLVAANNFNGFAVTEMLDPSSTLAANTTQTVELTVNVRLTTKEGLFLNTAFARGVSAGNSDPTEDQSTTGTNPDPFVAGDVSPKDPTIVEMLFPELFIPEGFSPNNDGTNDTFVIRNARGGKIEIEIFNRWGNRVYRSADYQNDWDGRCQEKLCLGQDLPTGTYYYIIHLGGTDKYSGYITLNR